jgi:hypothetical protein
MAVRGDIAPGVDPVRDEGQVGDFEEIAVVEKLNEAALVKAVRFGSHRWL